MKNDTNDDILRCSFCNKTQKEVRKLIAGPTVFICNECVDICLDIIVEDRQLEARTGISARDLVVTLDKNIVGQNAAKIALSSAFFRHHLRPLVDQNARHAKSNILLVGPRGSGKTSAVRLLAQELGFPCTAVDAYRFTGQGLLRGTSFLEDLYAQAGHITANNEPRSVVCIEHIDRIAGWNEGNDPELRAQETLLEILEGETVEISTERGRTEKVRTHDVLFVCCGTFPDLDPKMGSEGIIRYGFLPELAAQLPVCIGFEALTGGDMVRILTSPGGPLQEYLKLFDLEGMSLSVTQEALQAIADEAARRQGGARSLRALLESMALEVSAELATRLGPEEYVVDERFIRERVLSAGRQC